MPEQDLTLKISQEGAQSVIQAVSQLQKAFKELVDNAKKSQDEIKPPSEQVKGGFTKFIDSLKDLRGQFLQGQQASQGFGGILNVLAGAFSALTSPIGIASLAIGALVLSFKRLADQALQVYESLKRLEASTGMSARQADIMADAFTLAGVDSEAMNAALFRLANQVETGGEALQRFGISVRDVGGNLKEPGQLLLEVRNSIAELGDAGARNAALMELFGRAGRAMAPAFAISKEKMGGFLDEAERSSAITEKTMKRMMEYREATVRLNQAWEDTKIRIAEVIALPVMTFLIDTIKGTVDLAESVGNKLAPAFLVLWRVLGVFTVGGPTRLLEAMFPKAADVKTKADETIKGTEVARKTILEGEAKQLAELIRMRFDADKQQLEANAQFHSERLKLEKDAGSEATRARLTTNETLIEMQRKLYDDLIALEERRVGGRVPKEVELKLAKERDEAIRKLENDSRILRLTALREEAAETQKIVQQQTQTMRLASDERVAIIEMEKTRRLALNEIIDQTSIQKAVNREKIEVDAAERTMGAKVTALDDEIKAQRAYAEQYPQIKQVQVDVENRIMELQGRRAQASREADKQIIDSRKSTVQELQNLANQEAGIGDALTNKAIENLKKQGRTTISKADIAAESERIQAKAGTTAGMFEAGGAVNIEKLQETMGVAGTFKSITAMGSSVVNAVSQMAQGLVGAFTGQRGPAAPIGMGGGAFTPSEQAQGSQALYEAELKRYELQQEIAELRKASIAGTTAGVPGDPTGGQVSATITAVQQKGDAAITQMVERIPDVMGAWFEKFTDGLIRKLEFEAART